MNRNALKMFFLCTMAAAAFIVFIVSINAGYSHLSLADIFKGLLGTESPAPDLSYNRYACPVSWFLCYAGQD